MTRKEVEQLHNGDEVFWNDPDEGTCSRVYRIRCIEIAGDIVTIEDVDGSTLECFIDELS